ncbi:OsmC family protein [Phyllobacterium chamaecytisi]|uniref:OsmC family protein n=1 Tax=Phyllobacterium chamaecytisi TaxID=2876082 RepID=UPI001CCBE064|nr:OsmC family protein [Phyllobacterium sp. KW56]MBZ9603223.1 OsmC family protein [Phyllobacterium sp. KW56]
MSISEQLADIVTVSAVSVGTQGRQIVTAGSNHFVADRKSSAGGLGEAVQAGELLLAALASCAIAVIESNAAERNIPIGNPDVSASFERDPEDVTRYRWIRLEISVPNVDAIEQEALVEAFRSTCPIFNTLKRGGTIEAVAALASES